MLRESTRIWNVRLLTLYLVLVLAAVAGNYFSIPMFFGVNFLFGSIFTLIAVHFFGITWVAIASTLAAAVTYSLWGQSFTFGILSLEVVAVWGLYRRTKRELALLDMVFWAIVGVPAAWLFLNKIPTLDSTAVTVIMLKLAFNGVFNALIADTIITYIPLQTWLGLPAQEKGIPLRKTVLNLVALAAVIPALIILAVTGMVQYRAMQEQVHTLLESEIQHADAVLTTWTDEQMNVLKAVARSAPLGDPQQLHSIIGYTHEALPAFHSIYVVDADGTVLAASPRAEGMAPDGTNLNFADRQYFRAVRDQREPYVSDVILSRGLNIPVVTLSVPIMRDGQLRGAVVGAVRLSEVRGLLESSRDFFVTVTGRDQRVITSSRPSVLPLNPFAPDPHTPGRRWENPVVFDGTVQSIKSATAVQWRKALFFGSSSMQGMPWQLVAEAPVGPFQSEFYQFNIVAFSVMLFLIILALIFAQLADSVFARPLTVLADITTALPSKLPETRKIAWPRLISREGAALVDNYKSMAASMHRLITKLREANTRIEHDLNHDALTGLPNRHYLLDKVFNSDGRPQGQGSKLILVLVDLFRFKNINEILGYEEGDRLLRIAAKRLQTCCRAPNELIRHGGDEFIVIMPGKGGDEAENLAGRILAVMGPPFTLSVGDFPIQATIGISVFPDHGQTATELIRHAEAARVDARSTGPNSYKVYSSTMDVNDATLERLELERDLHHALDNDEFIVHYQPQIDIESGDIDAVEALVRWNHPRYGMVFPGQFIAVAEETGLIGPLTKVVLHKACQDISAWNRESSIPLRVAVNLSAMQLRQGSFPGYVEDTLRRSGLKPQHLELEVTETAVVMGNHVAEGILKTLKHLGVSIALDDFGTGYSSLQHLRRMPVDVVKIDQSFVQELGSANEGTTIVRATLAMAKNLHLHTVAEGVETEGQLNVLRELGCGLAQGYYFCRPVPLHELKTKYTQLVQGTA